MAKLSETIMVVDDEEYVRLLVQRTLQKAGYTVITARDGIDAMSKLDDSNVGAMILDIKMPGMDGIDVLKEVMKKYPHTCIIMLTAYGNLEIAIDAMKMGACDYITKPFDSSDLVERLEAALEKRKKKQKNGGDIDMGNIWPTGLNPHDWDVI